MDKFLYYNKKSKDLFLLIGIAKKKMIQNKLSDKIDEMVDRARSANNYEEAARIILEYTGE